MFALGRTLLIAGTLLATAGASAASAAPAKVPCTPGGAAGQYNCNWYVTGDGHSGGAPVVASSRTLVGYLHKGSNWVICQRVGARETSGGYYNNNWAWTLADDNRWGWVNAVYASGGDNDGAFGGVPDCHNGHGQPPGGSPEAGLPNPQVTAPVPEVPPPGQPEETQAPPPRPTTCGSAPGPGDNVTRWNPVVVCVLGMLGQPAGADIVNAVDVLIEHESSGNPNAVNLWDSNARAGHPSKGLIQTIPTTFQANRSPVLVDNIFDPAANIYAGLNYGINRYGSIRDIPGIRNVLNGGGYVGYATTQAKGLSRAGHCGSVKTGRLVLALNAKGVKCASARLAARALDRSATVRRATGLVENVQVRSSGRIYVCDVDGQGRNGARRAVFCQSGPRTLWWTARKR